MTAQGFWVLFFQDLSILTFLDNENKRLIHLRRRRHCQSSNSYFFAKLNSFFQLPESFLNIILGLFQEKPYLPNILVIVSWEISIKYLFATLEQSFLLESRGLLWIHSITKFYWSALNFVLLPEPSTLQISP